MVKERQKLVAAFMSGDIEAYARLCNEIRAKLKPRPDRRKFLQAMGRKGAAARWRKGEAHDYA